MNKTVLVTGACINTGVAIVEKFASEGYNVVFTGRNSKKVKEAENNYAKKYTNVSIMGYVINSLINESTIDEESVKEMFKVFDEKNIFIETVVLNAADQGLNMEIFKNPLKDFMRVINTNMTWNYCLCEYAARRMKINGGGNIVFVNSNTAYRAIPNRIAYQASKSGQLGMMRGLAFDLGTYNIRVNAVELGEFTIATAKAVKEVRPDAKIVGGVVCNRILNFLNTALKTGMGDYIGYISFHEYTANEQQVFEKVSSYRALAKIYNSDVGIIQGESGGELCLCNFELFTEQF